MIKTIIKLVTGVMLNSAWEANSDSFKEEVIFELGLGRCLGILMR